MFGGGLARSGADVLQGPSGLIPPAGHRLEKLPVMFPPDAPVTAAAWSGFPGNYEDYAFWGVETIDHT